MVHNMISAKRNECCNLFFTNPVFLEQQILFRFFEGLSVQNSYHLHKSNNSSKQLQFVMLKNKLLTVCLFKFDNVTFLCMKIELWINNNLI